MKRGLILFVGTLVALAMTGALGSEVASAASKPLPKVVLIVGPVGAATDGYRRLADEAAAAAADFTPNVIRLYSPDATWTAVRQALQGASIVVYLGHGNGWPSRYRDSLYPATQDGFGLNPTAGAGDTHQYFGEDAIGREVKLAPHAVVVLSHLCYASGNSEPGLEEGPLEIGQQRVDNYAAGFVRAGAAAVIADAYLSPAYYVRSILAGGESIDRVWRSAPSYKGNLLQFASLRSKGFVAQMDSDTPTSGFHRSIVLRAGLTAARVIGSATRIVDGRVQAPLDPTLAGLGIRFDQADLAAPPTAGSTTKLAFRVTAAEPASIPAGLMVGVRWDPIQIDRPPPIATPASPETAPAAPGAPVASIATHAGSIDLVSPEVAGEIVAPAAARKVAGGLSVAVKIPTTPGLYRLVATIHQADGVAFDAATQALVPALIVRVTGRLTATYVAPGAVAAVAGKTVDVPVTVSNLGTTAWGSAAVAGRRGLTGAEFAPARRATVVARWIDLSSSHNGAVIPESSALLPPGLAPRHAATAVLRLPAPGAPGEYLVLIDVLVPNLGSLAIAGVPPALVRVSVSGASGQPTP
jgi:hypothetical protein